MRRSSPVRAAIPADHRPGQTHTERACGSDHREQGRRGDAVEPSGAVVDDVAVAAEHVDDVVGEQRPAIQAAAHAPTAHVGHDGVSRRSILVIDHRQYRPPDVWAGRKIRGPR